MTNPTTNTPGDLPPHVYARNLSGDAAVWSEEAVRAAIAQAVEKHVEVLQNLFDEYCSAMRSEYDFPGRPWTPERDNDEAALNARALLSTPAPASADPILDECECGYGCPPGCGCRHSGETSGNAASVEQSGGRPDSSIHAGCEPIYSSEQATLMQDENSGRDGRRYNEWHASRPDARLNAREAAGWNAGNAALGDFSEDIVAASAGDAVPSVADKVVRYWAERAMHSEAAVPAPPSAKAAQGHSADLFQKFLRDEFGTSAVTRESFSFGSLSRAFGAGFTAHPTTADSADALDAARYRALRDHVDPDAEQPHCVIHKTNDWGNWFNEWVTGEALDDAIDALIAARAAQGK